MGLDMYLYAKRYLRSSNKEDSHLAKEIQNLFPELSGLEGQFDRDDPVVKEIKIEIGYWRKANAIHRWFVDNVQDGEDNCQPHYVWLEHLAKLKEVCEAVLADPTKAEELLPTVSGFFFGNTSYGEYYIQDLENTVEIINNCLKLTSASNWTFEYQSSW